MSLPLLQAVLSSNHTKSSIRLAQVLLAWHACSRCGRVFISAARLASEMNIHPSKAKVHLKHLRNEKLIEPTGEFDPSGVPVYRLQWGGSESATGDDINRSESATGGVAKSCRFCQGEVAKALPNKQVVQIDQREDNTTTPPTPLSEGMAPKSTSMVEVGNDFAIAHGEKADKTDPESGHATDGIMASAMVTPFDVFADAYWSHKGRRKAKAEWDRQQLDSTLPDIFEALAWQPKTALPEYPHVYLENKGWLDQRPASPSARPYTPWPGEASEVSDGNGQVLGPAVVEGLRCREPGCHQTPVYPCTRACAEHTEEIVRESAGNIEACMTQARKYGELNLENMAKEILTRDYVAPAVPVLMQALTLDRWRTCHADEIPTVGQLAHYLRERMADLQEQLASMEVSA